MRAIPVYNNFYTEKGLKEIFTPNDVFNINQWQENGFSSTYLIMYTYQPSTHLEQENSGYVNDGMDIGRTIVTTDTMELFNDIDKGYAVPTFAVTYGMQNQNYFKSININMDNPITTDYSIANQLMISQTAASGGDLNLPVGIGQNIYSIYSNRSYTCTVEMMGCANIMPMMYFQLNNIPMFKGAYMITSVKHSIRGGNMTTIFTGVRQTSIIYPFVNSTLILTTLLERLGSSSNLGGTNSRYIGSEAKTYTGITKAILVSKDSSLQIVDKNLLELPWKIHTRGGRIKNYPLGERKNNKITTIILHYTAGLSSEKGNSEKYGASWNQLWNTKYDYEASADFCVDDGQIVQYNPNVKQFYTYSTNNDRNIISIEMCSTFNKNKNPNLATNNLEPNMPQWSFSQKVLDNTQKLIYMLCDEYNDGKMLDIKTHYNKTGKSCPGIVGWNDGFLFDENKQKTNNKNNSVKFNDFVKKVKEGYNVRTNK